ncbi:MAG: hypothetical protein KAS32_23930 [Candidatus Peribacteraceae bacterium]|nr:hypothetical protein [Candidatus Peribacteraceae bacterium]
MDIVKEPPTDAREPTKLSKLSGGNVFHFADIDFDTAIQEDAVYMVVNGIKDKESRIQIANLKDGLLLMRDDCHRVCKLKAQIAVDE